MKSQAILTLIGQDKPGIIAAVSQVLYNAGCSIEDTSLSRVGNYFSMLQILRYPADLGSVEAALELAIEKFGLRLRLDPVSTPLSGAELPCNCVVTITGPDHPGIMASVSGALESIHCNIISLQGHLENNGDYIMTLRVGAPRGSESVEEVLRPLHASENIEICVQSA